MNNHIDAWSLGINAYAWIRRNIEYRSGILELGTGAVSDLLEIDYMLLSIEHDERFLKHYSLHCPIKNGWYDLPDIHMKWDLLIIDGPPQKIGRGGVLKSGLIERSPKILVDDVNREKDMKLAEAIRDITGREMSVHRDGNKKFATI